MEFLKADGFLHQFSNIHFNETLDETESAIEIIFNRYRSPKLTGTTNCESITKMFSYNICIRDRYPKNRGCTRQSIKLKNHFPRWD